MLVKPLSTPWKVGDEAPVVPPASGASAARRSSASMSEPKRPPEGPVRWEALNTDTIAAWIGRVF